MNTATYPILEFDPTREALIEPSRTIRPRDVPEYCVICFFKEVIEKVVVEQQAKVVVDARWEDGPHPLYEMAYHDQRLAFFHPGVGGALAAGLLEEAIAFNDWLSFIPA
jgi:uridine phosphorylase